MGMQAAFRRVFVGVMCLVGLFSLPAQAVIISVGGVDYDVVLSDGGLPLTGLPAETFVSPWWGNQALATEAANNFHAATAGNYGAGISSAVFAFNRTGDQPSDSLTYIFVSAGSGNVFGPNTLLNSSNFSAGAAVAYAIPITAVPEIDGNALAKALFCLFTLALWLQVRRNRRRA